MVGLNMRPLFIITLLVGLISERWKSSRIICTLLILSISSLIVIPNALGLPNPATEYCVSFGYKYDIIKTPEGEYGICIFPDGSFCIAWDFYYGKCGEKWRTNVSMGNATLLWRLPFLSAAFFGDIAVSDNGNFIVFIGSNGSSVILMTKSGQKVFEVSADAYAENPTEAIDISGDGTFIIVGSSDNYAKIYKNTGELYFEYSLDSHPQSVSISKDGKIAVVGTENGLYIFDVVNKKLIRFYSIGCVRTTAISDNGEYIACGCGRNVYVFNKNGEKIWGKCLSLGEYECIEDVQISNNGLIAVSCTYSVYVFDVFSNKLISSETSCYHLPRAGVSPDGNYFVLAEFDDDHTVISLNNKDGAEIWKIYWPGSVHINDILVSYNAKWILTSINNAILLLFDKNGNEVFRRNLTGMYTSLDMTTNGMYFAVLDYSFVEFFQNNLAIPEETTCCPCEITTDKEVYNPGDQITITIKFCNEEEICPKSTKSIQIREIETKEEGRGTTAISRTNNNTITIDTASANRYVYYDYAYLEIVDHYCAGYDVYVNGEYYFTEDGDGKCGFYIPCNQYVTVELRKDGCKISETFYPYCGYGYLWEITENWCSCGSGSEYCDPETFAVLIHKPSGTVDITRYFERISAGVYRAIVIIGEDSGEREIEVIVPGCSPLTKKYYVNYPPVANFTYTPQTPKTGEEIAFDASSSYDPDGQIVKYEWDFGDGNVITTTEPVVTHVYTQPGSYTVTLIVIDDNGLSSSVTNTIVVQKTDIYEYPEGYWNRRWFVILPGQEFKDENRVYVYPEKISQLNFYHKHVTALDPYKKCVNYVYWYCNYKTSICPYDSPDYVGFVATRTVELDGGEYMITLGSDDGGKIWIDNNTIIDLWSDHHYIEVTKILNLSPGKHKLKIEYYNHIGGGKAKFEIKKIQSGGKVIYDRYWWDGYWMSNTSKCIGSCKLRENYTAIHPDMGFCSVILGSEAYLASDSGCYGICMYYGSFKVPSKGLYRITWKFNLTAKGGIKGANAIGSVAAASVAGVKFKLERWINATVKDEKLNETLIIYEISQPESLGDAFTNAIASYMISKALETVLKEWSMFVPSISSYDEEYYKHMVYQNELELEEDTYDWYVFPTEITASVAMGAGAIGSAGGIHMQLEEVKVEQILAEDDLEYILKYLKNNNLNLAIFSCPVNITITDQYGRVLSDDGINEIPNARVEIVGETKMFYIPSNLTYTVNVDAYDYGNFSLTLLTANEEIATFSNISVNPNTEAVVHISPFSAPTMDIDYDGDGNTDEQLISPVSDYSYSISGLTVNFDASSSYDPDGQIIKYEWDFGDGTSATTSSPIVQHTYTQSGNYTVTLTVTDNDGLKSSTTEIITVIEEMYTLDQYEPDDTMDQASTMSIGESQHHNFHKPGDVDWIKFYAQSGHAYIIETYNLGDNCNTVIYLYDSNGNEITYDDDSGTEDYASKIEWTCQHSGYYYVKVKHYSNKYGEGTDYWIRVYEKQTMPPFPSLIEVEAPETVIVGETFDVNVYISGISDLQSFALGLIYNKDLIEFQQATLNIDSGWVLSQPVERDYGYSFVAYAMPETEPLNATEKTKIMTITFKALSEGTVEFNFSSEDTGYNDGQEFDVMISKSVKITVSFIQYYDLNSDGKISGLELLLAIQDWRNNKITGLQLLQVIQVWRTS